MIPFKQLLSKISGGTKPTVPEPTLTKSTIVPHTEPSLNTSPPMATHPLPEGAIPDQPVHKPLIEQRQLQPARAKSMAFSRSPTRDVLFEMMANNLLAAPSTHLTNFLSNATIAVMRPGETLTRAMLTTFADPTEKTYYSEFAASVAGLAVGTYKALKFGAKALPAIVSRDSANKFGVVLQDMGYPTGLLDSARIELNKRSIKASALGLEYKQGLHLSNLAALSADTFGTIQNVPGVTLNYADLSFKIMNAEIYLAEQATHMVMTGKAKSIADAKQILLRDPNAAKQIIREAESRTLMSQPKHQLLQWVVSKHADALPGLRWIVPFKRAIANSLEYGFERSPFALAFPAFRKSLLSSNKNERYDAWSKMIWGSSVITTLAATIGPYLTGEFPRDKLAKELYESEGLEEFSLKMPGGGEPLKLDNMGPIGNLLKVVVLYRDWASNLRIEDIQADVTANSWRSQELIKTFAEFVQPVALTAYDNFWGQNIADFLTAFDMAVENASIGPLLRFLTKTAAHTAPFGNRFVIEMVTRTEDPFKHEWRSWDDYFKSLIPKLSKRVPYSYTLFGQPIRYSKFNGPGARDLGDDPYDPYDPVVQDLRKYKVEPEEPRDYYQKQIGSTHRRFRYNDEEWAAFNSFIANGVPEWGIEPLHDRLRLIKEISIPQQIDDKAKHNAYRDAIAAYRSEIHTYMATSSNFSIAQKIADAEAKEMSKY